ncbi:hypothetical protein Phum_PHUM294490 [Pediculus humanus corporis]|uniref:Uncharacterized protein n=1 Tax=Pediculus humanus subsp. corporis TaxID=121224 RepID=E0VLW3_PEDHC|nr:uncharacterized protein Phum_PHUM294490 [Pediculus humanus corporis]EEB14369.1 hypothetical protein Phum_PHUM294490 [Pediculus humanus corporis]
MKTVSSTPRPKPGLQSSEGSISQYLNNYHKDLLKRKNQLMRNEMVNHIDQNEVNRNYINNNNNNKSREQFDAINHDVIKTQNVIDARKEQNEDDKDKKKEKKWTLGGFFRRKTKKDSDESSEESGHEGIKGFLSRRKSKRDKRKLKTRSTANRYDVIIPQVKESGVANGGFTENGNDYSRKNSTPSDENANLGIPIVNGTCNQVRFIHRHPAVSNSENSKPNKDLLNVPKHSRQDSNLSRSSGGSESLEGRKNRKEMMARAEAKRDLICDESSSEEEGSHHSNSSLNRMNYDYMGYRRSRRLEKSKRLSKDENNFINIRGNDLRVIKSDFEGSRSFPSNYRYAGRSSYRDPSDYEEGKLNLINYSAGSSPSRSPRNRKRQLRQYLSYVQSSYPTSTFPPGVYNVYQTRNVSGNGTVETNYPMKTFSQRNQNTYDALKGDQPLNHDYFSKLPRSMSVTENLANQRTKLNSEECLLTTNENNLKKSFSSDHGINRPLYYEGKVMEHVPLPIMPKPCVKNDYVDDRLKCMNLKNKNFQTSIRINKTYNEQINERSPCFETCKYEVAENRTDSTPSYSSQSGSFPLQPTHVVRRSASGNSFCNPFENFNDLNPNRSNSYQHIPTFYNQRTQNFSRYKPNSVSPNAEMYSASADSNESKVLFNSQSDNGVPKSPVVNGADAKPTIYSSNFLKFMARKPNFQGNKIDESSYKQQPNPNSSILRYYADQNPRSRNPIHITCHPAINSENSYLPESGATNATENLPPESPTVSASEFWKQRDREMILKNNSQLHNNAENSLGNAHSLKPPINSNAIKTNGSRSNSPRSVDIVIKTLEKPITKPEKVNDVTIDLERNAGGFRENTPVNNTKPKMHREEYSVEKMSKIPPEPPVRQLSKEDVLKRLQKCQKLKEEEENNKTTITAQNGNLDDALNELEVIYNSLKLKDEDLADRAERRDFPAFRTCDKAKEYDPVVTMNRIQSFKSETDYIHNNKPISRSFSENAPGLKSKAVSQRRSGIPDKMCDDMAFRRLNTKDRQDSKKFPLPSYLRSSSGLSPVLGVSPNSRKESPVNEPDVTYDDVVFRNIRHANSTLKIQDPQPPFGIPIGVIAPAANSDYLHATPKNRFRPTFTSSKTPDVVKDDLAFRNLRKDSKASSDLNLGKTGNDNFLKKRAVRSLSANIYNIMHKENLSYADDEVDGVGGDLISKTSEKTQSLTDLTNKSCLEKRLKELKEGKNTKRAEFFEVSQKPDKINKSLSWTKASQNPNEAYSEAPSSRRSKNSLAGANDNNNKRNEPGKTDSNGCIEDTVKITEKKFRSPVVELSKYPAAIPASSLQGNPFKENVGDYSVDEEQLENLLTALAKEAKSASQDLEKQLDDLKKMKRENSIDDNNDGCVPRTKENQMSEIVIDVNKNKNSFNNGSKTKRRRNLSLSNANEPKEETRKTNSLERRRSKRQSQYSTKNNNNDDDDDDDLLNLISNKLHLTKWKSSADDSYREKEHKSGNTRREDFNEIPIEPSVKVLGIDNEKNIISSRKAAKMENVVPSPESNSFSTNDEKQTGFDKVTTTTTTTDLSEILHSVEVEQHLNEELSESEKKSINGSDACFQQVYEYNCKLIKSNEKEEKVDDDNSNNNKLEEETSSVKKSFCINGGNNINVTNVKKTIEEPASDVEREFEKIHDEVNNLSTKKAKEKMSRTSEETLAATKSTNSRYSAYSFSKDQKKMDITDDDNINVVNNNRRKSFNNDCSGSSSSSGSSNDRERRIVTTTTRRHERCCQSSSKGEEGEVKKMTNLSSNVWLACSYALAFAFHLQDWDVTTALGIVIAVMSIIAFLVL